MRYESCTGPAQTHAGVSRCGVPGLVRGLLAVVLLASLAGGCARARAADVPIGPPLAIPPPPERVLAPVEEAPLATTPGRTDTLTQVPEVVQKPAAAPPATAPAGQTRQEQPAAPPAASPATAPAPELARQVRASGEDAALRGEVEKLLSSVEANLNRVAVSTGNRQQLDEIRSLSDLARKALNERNYQFARLQADKAAKLFKELLGR